LREEFTPFLPTAVQVAVRVSRGRDVIRMWNGLRLYSFGR